MPGSIDSCHLQGIGNAYALGYGNPYHVIDIAAFQKLRRNLVIRAEHKIRCRIRIDSRQQCLEILGSRALPEHDANPGTQPVQCLLLGNALTVRGNPCCGISHQLAAGEPGRMSVHMHACTPCHAQLFHDTAVLCQHSRRIHHLRQPQHPGVLQKRFQIICQKLCPCIFKLRGRHAGRQHDIHIQRNLLSCIQHKLNPLRTADIGNLMRIRNDRSHAAGQCRLGKLIRRKHGALDMHMGINQPRNDIPSAHIYFFNAKIRPCPGNIAISNSYIPQNKLTRKNVKNLRIFQHQVRRLQSLSHPD